MGLLTSHTMGFAEQHRISRQSLQDEEMADSVPDRNRPMKKDDKDSAYHCHEKPLKIISCEKCGLAVEDCSLLGWSY